VNRRGIAAPLAKAPLVKRRTGLGAAVGEALVAAAALTAGDEMPAETGGDPASTLAAAGDCEAAVGAVDTASGFVQAATDPTQKSTSAIPGKLRQEPVTIRSSLPGRPDGASARSHRLAVRDPGSGPPEPQVLVDP
jgi:hypothetical protein